MEKPTLSGMTNRDAIQNGFHDTWKITYTIPSDIDLSDPEYKEYCLLSGFSIINSDNGETIKTIPYKTFIKPKATFDLSDKYNGDWLGLTFSSQQKDFLAQHGRTIFKANSGFLQDMINQTSYDGDGGMPDGWWDERANNYDRLWGSPVEYKRYPYNTILVTSDLLLHLYHRVFDNSLKYFEETTARPMLTDLSKSLFTKFLTLSQKTTDQNLKKNYEMLAAYRSIPYSILIPNNEMIDKINNSTNGDPEASADLSDEQVQKLIIARQKTIIAKLPTAYQQAMKDTLTEIFKANNSKGKNILLETFSPTLISNFGSMNTVKFDFTQFKPRAHYTTDSLLKTYFMAMKWLMREKLFFADKNVATAALVMVNNIRSNDLTQFTTFYNFIQKLIGEDDDVNITDVQTFIADQKRASDQAILKWVSDAVQKKLMVLRPQKIISLSYNTPEEQMLTEQQAKDLTAGFIFFGEKFTIDSRFFDQFTAGSAEKESEYKPRVQSALMVADNLLNTPITQKFTKLRLEKNAAEFEIQPAQIAGYNKIKWDVSKNEILTKFNRWATIYHRRLGMLTSLFINGWANAPYYQLDALYGNKLLNTFLGSYTELKHDTLLYVKQAYAELGGGGDGPCYLTVDPPALPIPKWYVEASPDVIDQIISLTQETNTFFTGEAYNTLLGYLQLFRKIAIAQTKNEKISDQDFEDLRLASTQLVALTTPQKLFGEPLQKEKRWSIIADIFTSGKYGPLYEAVGRPYMMALMINDANGARIALWPIFSHYEFYPTQAPFEANGGGRLTDQDRQNNYDALKWTAEINLLSLPLQELITTNK